MVSLLEKMKAAEKIVCSRKYSQVTSIQKALPEKGKLRPYSNSQRKGFYSKLNLYQSSPEPKRQFKCSGQDRDTYYQSLVATKSKNLCSKDKIQKAKTDQKTNKKAQLITSISKTNLKASKEQNFEYKTNDIRMASPNYFVFTLEDENCNLDSNYSKTLSITSYVCEDTKKNTPDSSRLQSRTKNLQKQAKIYCTDVLLIDESDKNPDRDIKRKANKHSKYINNNRNAKLPQNNAKICKTEVYENFKTHKVDQIKNKDSAIPCFNVKLNINPAEPKIIKASDDSLNNSNLKDYVESSDSGDVEKFLFAEDYLGSLRDCSKSASLTFSLVSNQNCDELNFSTILSRVCDQS